MEGCNVTASLGRKAEPGACEREKITEDHKSQDAKGPRTEREGHKVCGRGLRWADPEEWAGFSRTGRGGAGRGTEQRDGQAWLRGDSESEAS